MGNAIYKYSRWILAGILLIAGILKIINPENLVEVLLFFGLLNEFFSYVFTYLISAIEIILGILLVYQVQYRLIHKIVFSMFVLFLAISFIGYLDNWQFACGCLGRFSFGKFDISMVIRNFIFVLIASSILWGKGLERAPNGALITTKKRGKYED